MKASGMLIGFLLCLAACSAPALGPEETGAPAWSPPPIEKPTSIIVSPWQEAVVSVRDLETSARFFLEVAGYDIRWQGQVDDRMLAYWGLPAEASAEAWLLGRPGVDQGLVRLVQFENAGQAEPMRPGSRAWDTGCFFSLMVRAKNLRARYEEALALGWWTETPIADLEFGTSKLKIVIFKGPDGLQVQAYERLTPALPETIGPFERMTQPFNVMQIVADRDKAREFYVGQLGFETFFFGPPYVDPEPVNMPLGIPINLTTSVRYGAGIYFPQPGEFGRVETIEVMDLDGQDYSARCNAPNYGILSVRFPVENMDATLQKLSERGVPIQRAETDAQIGALGSVRMVGLTTPDGAMIDVFEKTGE